MRYYDWTLSTIFGDVVDEGFIYQDSDRAAKSEASKLTSHYEWKGVWKEDKLNGGWVRYNGDARVNPVYFSSRAKTPTHCLHLRETERSDIADDTFRASETY